MPNESQKDARNLVFNCCQEMQKAALVIGSSGNISLRISGTDQIAITPSGIDYSCLSADEVIILDLEGKKLKGDCAPSMEHPMHRAIYAARPDVHAIVHTHSTYASALAVLRFPIPKIIDELVFQLGGQVEVADYAVPGSHELADNVVKALGPRNAVLLANHGGLAVGSTLEKAYQNALLLERAAHIYLLACAVDPKKIHTISS